MSGSEIDKQFVKRYSYVLSRKGVVKLISDNRLRTCFDVKVGSDMKEAFEISSGQFLIEQP